MILPDFTPNNVEFQLMATSAWKKYYSVREFALNQVILSKDKFHPSCKESFLYTSNITRIWLIGLEEDIKKYKHSKHPMDLKTLVKDNMDRLESYFDSMDTVMREHPDNFDQGYCTVFLNIFHKIKPSLFKKIQRGLKNDIENNFFSIIDFASKLMEHFLHILYEMDYLFYNKDNEQNYLPFIGIDPIDIGMYKDRNVSLVNIRLEVYKEFDLIKEDSYWTVKSYCSSQFLDSDYRIFELHSKLLSEIELHGIRLSCIM